MSTKRLGRSGAGSSSSASASGGEPLLSASLPELSANGFTPYTEGKPFVRGAVYDKQARDNQLGLSAHFGTHLAISMRNNLKKKKRLFQNQSLKRALAVNADDEDMDLRETIHLLTEQDMWEFCQRCSHCTALNLSGWAEPSWKSLRSLALSVVPNLQRLDLSKSGVTDTHIEVIAVRFFHLELINLSRCERITNTTIKQIATGAYETLTSLDVSHCMAIDGDGLEWLGGTVGYGKGACARLQSLNVEGNERIRDHGLVALGAGCASLQFVNLGDCEKISDIGVEGLTRGCPSLRLLNLQRCTLVSDDSCRAIAQHCHLLKSLNLNRCLRLTDAGLEAIARGCKQLQSLNIGACHEVTPGGIAAIASECKGLQLLNMTGCDRVAESALTELVEGLRFCEIADSFLGFKPRSNAIEMKFRAQQQIINDAAAMRIQTHYRGYLTRKAWLEVLEHQRRMRAATVVGLWWRRTGMAIRHASAKVAAKRYHGALLMQCLVRVVRSRRLLEKIRAPFFEAIEQTHSVTLLQAVIRGARARKRCWEVPFVICELRRERWAEVMECAATVIQGQCQIFLTKRKVDAIAEESVQRRRDCLLATVKIQRVARGYAARVRVAVLKMENDEYYWYMVWAATAVQRAFRGHVVRVAIKKLREEMERLRLLREASAIYIQAQARGYIYGILPWRRMRDERLWEDYYASQIQRIFRGYLVPDWEVMKWGKVVGMIRHQYTLDMVEVRKDVVEKDFTRMHEAGRDSASDDGNGSSSSEEEFRKIWNDELKQHVWYNYATAETRLTAPLGDQFEQSLVGEECQVYWEMEEKWFRGMFTKWNKRKKRHRIDYEDGDHEWMRLDDNQARVQILEGEDKDEYTGEVSERWIMYEFYQPPTRRKRRREDKVQRDRLHDIKEEEEKKQQEEKEAKRDKERNDLLEQAEKERDGAWVREFHQDTGEWTETNQVTGETRPYVSPEMKEWLEKQEKIAAWQEGVDETTGRTYFYNAVTQETTWTRPAEMPMPEHETSLISGTEQQSATGSILGAQGAPEFDPGTTQSTIMNTQDLLTAGGEDGAEEVAEEGDWGETTEWVEEGEWQGEGGEVVEWEEGGGGGESGEEAPVPPKDASLNGTGWVMHTDEESGRPYYYNEETGETSWDTPA